jgi:hypothetical protein
MPGFRSHDTTSARRSNVPRRPAAIYYRQRQWTTVLRNGIDGFFFNPINIGTFNFYTMPRKETA